MSVNEWLEAELDRMWLVAERRLRRMQEAGLDVTSAALPAIESILSARASKRAVGLDEAIELRTRELPALRARVPLGALAMRLELRAIELDVLVTALAPLIDPAIVELFAIVRTGAARRGVDLALVADLFGLDRASRLELLESIDAERPLARWGLLAQDDPSSLATQRSLQIPADVLATLCGGRQLPPGLAAHARLARHAPTLDDLLLPAATREELVLLQAELARSGGANAPWFVLWGPIGAGRRELAIRLAAAAQRDALVFDPSTCTLDELSARLQHAEREALIRGSALVIGPFEPDGEVATRVMRALRRYPELVILAVTSTTAPRLDTEHSLHELALGPLAHPEAMRLWKRLAPAVDATAIVDGFSLTPGDIVAAVRTGRARAEAQGRALSSSDLRRGVDLRLRAQLGDAIERVEVRDTWSDLVLPDADLDRLREFVGRKRHASTVYGQWGLAKRIQYGKGMIALFSGPPGTGKTMLAGVIANELELDLYRVDLSQVVSKWQGETEKQLSRIFDIAERTQAVLLFDEADSLFGKRGDVEGGKDRFANLTVNYLLQRLERYPGVAVLTTNKEAALDEALQRRLSLHLRLELPEVPERARLWRSFLAPLPGAIEIDVEWLARKFELAGGSIKNAAVRAAFLAAADGQPLDTAVVVVAIERELDDMGRVVWQLASHPSLVELGVSVDDVILA
ncbi:MAG: ATP-binding protein [Kofleriaceae bacterium]